MSVESIHEQSLLAGLIDAVISRANETVVVVDGNIETPAGPTIQFLNEAAQRRTGFERGQLTGAPLSSIVMAGMLDTVLGQLRKARDTGTSFESELRAKDKSGKEYWMEISTVPIFDPQNQVKHFVRIGRDITRRKQAEIQREATQRLLASVFGVIESPLIVTNDAGVIMMVNVALTKQLGWTVIDSIGMPVSELVAPQDRDGLDRLFATFATSDKANSIGASFRHRAGTTVDGTLQLSAVKQPKSQNFFVIKLELRTGAAAGDFDQSVLKSFGAAGRTAVVAGKVQLLGLGPLRDELGPRWQELSGRIFVIAEQVIKQHLEPGDHCERSPEDDFVLLFERLAKDEAQAKVRVIGQEVRTRLIAEMPEMAEIQIASFAASISLNPDEAAAEGGILAAFGNRLDGERRQLEGNAREAAENGLRTGKVEWQWAETIERQKAPIAMACLPAELRGATEMLQSLGQSAYDLEGDVFLLTGAGQYVLSKAGRASQPLLIVPVRYATVAKPRDFEAWLKVARTLADAGKKRIAIEVTEIPRDVIRAKLADTAMHLATMFRSIAFELPTADRSFAIGLPISTRLATVPIARLTERGAIAIPTVTRLLKVLESRQCRLIVKDCGTPPSLGPLAEAGVKLWLSAVAG